MGGFAQTCIRILTGWVESLISQIWAISSDPKGSNLVTWIGENWKGIFLAMCVAGAASAEEKTGTVSTGLQRRNMRRMTKTTYRSRRRNRVRILPGTGSSPYPTFRIFRKIRIFRKTRQNLSRRQLPCPDPYTRRRERRRRLRIRTLTGGRSSRLFRRRPASLSLKAGV